MQLTARGAAVQPYEVTPNDVLWLRRAVQAEGPIQKQVAYVLINGFVWNRSKGGRGTLADWVRRYAQPVNPLWYESGEKHKAKFAAATTDAERAELVQKARVRERVHSTRTKFDPAVRRAVKAALTGAYRFKEQATDYARWNVDRSPDGYQPLAVITKGQNRPWRRPGAVDWEGYAVAGTFRAMRFPWVVLVLGSGLAAAAYFATLSSDTKKARHA